MECNEAFAAIALMWAKEFQPDPEQAQPPRRRDRDRPPARRERRPAHDHDAQPPRDDRGPVRLPDHVRRRRPGQRHRHRATRLRAGRPLRCSSSRSTARASHSSPSGAPAIAGLAVEDARAARDARRRRPRLRRVPDGALGRTGARRLLHVRGPSRTSCPVTKPPHAIHGTVRDHPWTVEAASATVGRARPGARGPVALRRPRRHALRPGAGFARRSRWKCTRTRGRCRRRAAGTRGGTGTCGRGDPLEVELHAETMYRRDGDDIPTGELIPIAPPPWDDCFTTGGTPAAVLHWPGAATLTIEHRLPVCRRVHRARASRLCVEPQSGPPDELNLRPRVVPPTRPSSSTRTWTWTLARP